jgi:hypothetical protein
MKIENISDYISWFHLNQTEAGIPMEFAPEDFYLPPSLEAVAVETHIGMRFVQQWTLAMELVSYLQPDQGLQVIRCVIKSMDVEWRG